MAYLEHIPLKPLYHYTTEAGFSGILKSREIWLSDLQLSNDPRDIQLGLETLKSLTREIGEKEYSPENAKVLDLLISKMISYFRSSRCYTTCFTPHPDDLNMWREYGGNGQGYSLGFRSRAITDMHGRIYKVRYVDDNSRSDLYNLVSEIVKPIEIYGEAVFKDVKTEVEMATALISIVNSLKHVTWQYENEVRLTFASGEAASSPKIPTSILPNGKEKHWIPHKIRQVNGVNVKYHSFPFGKFVKDTNDHREAIFEVVVGPKSKLSHSEVHQMLLDGGYSNFVIKKSVCAFR